MGNRQAWQWAALAAAALCGCGNATGTAADSATAAAADTAAETGTAAETAPAATADAAAETAPPADASAPADTGPPPQCKVNADCPPTGNPCVAAVCTGAGTCATQNQDGLACNPGDPCVVAAFCAAGKCAPSLGSWCQCQANSDCAALEDGNACNGTLYCDKGVFPNTCKVNPATVVVCDSAADTACTKSVCQPATGKCAAVAVETAKQVCLPGKGCTWQAKEPGELGGPQTVACEDGAKCTTGDYCQGGQCNPGTDTCSCQSTADCAILEDGDLCNGTLYCNKAQKPPVCMINPASILQCPGADDTPCKKNACHPKTGGCVQVPVEQAQQLCNSGNCQWEIAPAGMATAPSACDDGNPCTTGDTCGNGQCSAGKDTCLCKTDSDCASQDDGNLCNGTLFCNKATQKCQFNPASVVNCPSVGDTACAKNTCEPKTGVCAIANAATGTACDDGNSCTAGDGCDSGACKAGTFVCSCSNDADCVKYHDGDFCKGILYCNKAKAPFVCELNPATKVTCTTANDTACLKNVCATATGKCGYKPAAEFSDCDDGNPCTAGDTCQGGKCAGGPNTCECNVAADCAAKDDGNLCNGTWYCDKSALKPKCAYNAASVVFCSKGNDSQCVKNTCDPKTGQCNLQPLDDKTPCNDNSLCSQSAWCQAGDCVQAKAIDCDDKNPCTKDACDSKLGCTHAKANCDDGVACTLDVCDPATGQCSFDAKAMDGKVCDADANGCTVNDTCNAGKCIAGSGVVCKVVTGPCEKAVCKSTGANTFSCDTTAQADGVPCAASGSCFVGSSCKAGQCAQGKDPKLFSKTVAAAGANLQLRAAVPLLDGGFATAGAVEKGGVRSWQLQRFDVSGKPQWTTAISSKVDTVFVRPNAILAKGNGNLIVAGTTGAVNVTGALRALEVTGDGATPVWDVTVDVPGGSLGSGAVLHPAGGCAIVGRGYNGPNPQALAVRLSASGLKMWTYQGPLGTAALAARVESDGGLLLAGFLQDGSGQNGWLAKVDEGGAQQWAKIVPDATLNSAQFSAIATLPGKMFAIAGVGNAGGKIGAWLVQESSPGGPLGEYVKTGGYDARGIAALDNGVAVLAGGFSPGPQFASAWLHAVDASGHPLWTVTGEPNAEEILNAVATTPDGGLLAVGYTTVGGAQQGLIWRTDAWGHSDCTSAGVCAGLIASQCADNTLCTDDLCDGQQGCIHSANQQPCSDGDACTDADTCTQGVCKSPAATNCGDGNACTADNCDKTAGCKNPPISGPCPDGSICTSNEVCAGGVCKSDKLNCDDTNPCTQDTCDALSGCAHDALPDNSPCATGKVCVTGKCIAKWAIGVATSAGASCFLQPAGTVQCIGATAGGGINLGSLTTIGNLLDAVQIVGGTNAFCARTSQKLVRCFGTGGALGAGSCGNVLSSAAQLVPGVTDATDVGVGQNFGLAARSDGGLYAWGGNDECQLGTGICTACEGAVFVSTKISGVTHVGTGFGPGPGSQATAEVSIVIKSDGTAWASGAAGCSGSCGPVDGLAGNGSCCNATTFFQLAGISGAVQAATGTAHRLVLDGNGQIWGWGVNAYGEVGDGTVAIRTSPVKVFGQPAKAVKIAAGDHFSCAVFADGTAGCWGKNDAGQIGNGTNFGSYTPVLLPLDQVVAIAAGGSHACAVRADGSAWCWGFNNAGQLANGNLVTQLKPVMVPASAPK